MLSTEQKLHASRAATSAGDGGRGHKQGNGAGPGANNAGGAASNGMDVQEHPAAAGILTVKEVQYIKQYCDTRVLRLRELLRMIYCRAHGLDFVGHHIHLT